MKISRDIAEKYGDAYTAEEGMRAKSAEFAEQGHRVYLPLA